DRGALAAVDGAGGYRARGVDRVGETHHAGDHRLDALEFADGHVELLADARVGTGGPPRSLGAAGGAGGQRDAPPHRQLLDQHAPAAAGHLRAADDAVEWHEHVLALNRSVLEGNVERKMAPPDRDAGRLAWNERAGDADVGLLAEQLVGVEHAEREPDDRGDGGERDVALGEIEFEAEHLAPLVEAAADDAGIRDRPGIGAGARAG